MLLLFCLQSMLSLVYIIYSWSKFVKTHISLNKCNNTKLETYDFQFIISAIKIIEKKNLRSVYAWFNGANEQPINNVEIKGIGYSLRLSQQSPTTSPGFIPADWKHCASSILCRFISDVFNMKPVFASIYNDFFFDILFV